ncbi:hypothetical protein [Flocculibacter collagenilyticus]|uniref:hypothetical protein n=1 Tax=Flocculibacter collagenilyticus TaxID=2744479 RepID=UPI0018F728C4|nr:hypothetical protein [Flocculibacter collagenilyticus]
MKYILFGLILHLAFSVSANDDKAIVTQASNNFNKKLIALEQVESKCRESAIVLPADTFKSVSLSKEDKITALSYYFIKSTTECSSEAVKELLVASAVLSSLDEAYEVAAINSNKLIINSFKLLLEDEIEFNKIDKATREKLSKIHVLTKPFDPIRSAEVLGIH